LCIFLFISFVFFFVLYAHEVLTPFLGGFHKSRPLSKNADFKHMVQTFAKPKLIHATA